MNRQKTQVKSTIKTMTVTFYHLMTIDSISQVLFNWRNITHSQLGANDNQKMHTQFEIP